MLTDTKQNSIRIKSREKKKNSSIVQNSNLRRITVENPRDRSIEAAESSMVEVYRKFKPLEPTAPLYTSKSMLRSVVVHAQHSRRDLKRPV